MKIPERLNARARLLYAIHCILYTLYYHTLCCTVLYTNTNLRHVGDKVVEVPERLDAGELSEGDNGKRATWVIGDDDGTVE